ncbi:P-loop containing nucleoside triphosphate hydrolase protein [Leucogyrophana mollusca]|uniref:P-loop containing nucleoside triphosphate hydrolase protein n=1 Tax=Leucogyrophana mollusca TaxID=85980 RepID=A0ACB8B0J2_9AGAM|nr:P-loop containing nucleoside triphosphate hydrolase protein [Leucogyrophana mollusca]
MAASADGERPRCLRVRLVYSCTEPLLPVPASALVTRTASTTRANTYPPTPTPPTSTSAHPLPVPHKDSIFHLPNSSTPCLFEPFLHISQTSRSEANSGFFPGDPGRSPSATMPADVLEVPDEPVRVPDESTVDLGCIKQSYVAVEKEEWKLDTLCDLHEAAALTHTVVFCNTARKVDWLAGEMRARGFAVVAMHGDVEPGQRAALMEAFRSGSSGVLVTTDLVARGIDAPQAPLVINYDLPTERESYVHRVGRGGEVISFVATEDVRMLRDIERGCQSFRW